MQPEGVSFVNIGAWLGLLRWAVLALLIIATFALINKDKKEQKSKRSLAMLIFTAIAMPFLILEINFKNPDVENVDNLEEEILVPSKKPEIDDNNNLEPQNNQTDTEETQNNSEDSVYNNTAPRRSSYRPKEAPQANPEDEDSQTTPVTPDTPVDPDAPTVNYVIKHEKMDLDGEHYTLAVSETASGKAETKVTPATKEFYGFEAPTTQTITLHEGENPEVTYRYARNKYNFSYNGSTFVESSLPEDHYYYETEISLKAKERQGYHFTQWSNGETATTITITLNGDTTITPEYEANTDTPYIVRHRKMSAAGISYTEEEEPGTGTTDSEITPATRNYTGYTAPSTQTVTISGDGNTEVIYKYTPNIYTIEFDANGGTGVMANQPISYDNPTNLNTNSFTKTHYQFKHWNTAKDDSGESYTDGQQINNLAESGSIKLYAIWEAESYTISFDKNNPDATGTMSDQTVQFDSSFRLNANGYSLTYYNLAGWARSATATEAEFADQAEISENLTDNNSVTLYAVWTDTRIWRTVEFDANGGIPVDNMTIENGKTIPSLPSTSYTNHVFYGWWTEDGSTQLETTTPITANIKYIAHWKLDISQATVSPQTINVIRDQTALLSVVNKDDVEAYVFDSSDESIATINQSGTVTGKAAGHTTITLTGEKSGKQISVDVYVALPKYTLRFNSEGGAAVKDTIEVEEGSKPISLPSTTRENFVFRGWWSEDGTRQLTTDTQIFADETFHAHWIKSIKQAVVTPNPVTLERGQTTTLVVSNASEVEDYTWSVQDNTIATIDDTGEISALKIGGTKIIIEGKESHETIEIVITVEAPTYTVSFNTYGGSTVTDRNIKEGQTLSDIPTSTKENYVLEGWYTEEDGAGTKLTTETQITDNITFHAYWLKDALRANVNDNIEIELGDTAAKVTVLNASEIEPYTLASSDESIVTVDSEGNITTIAAGTTTIKLIGTLSGKEKQINIIVNEPAPSTVTVSFNAGDGECDTDKVELTKDSSIAESDIPTATQTYYDFLGWFTEEEGGEKLTSDTVISADITYYAHYTPKLICKAATELHEKSCPNSSSAACNDHINDQGVNGGKIIGIDGVNTITYGYLPNSHSPSRAGDAYDCDVNADGIYDYTTERFYYLNQENGIARLSYYSGHNGTTHDESQNWIYSQAIEKLPSNELWKNDLVPYSDGKKAKFPKLSDVLHACNLTESNMGTKGSIKSCIFLIENTAFDGGARSAIWLEKESPMRRIHASRTNNMNIATLSQSDEGSSKNTVRPTIQVKLDNIEKVAPVMHTVSFDTLGGTPIESITIESGESIDELPANTEKEGFQFKGWSLTNGGQKIEAPLIVDNDMVLYAIWGESNSVAVLNGIYYDTLQEAINRATDNKRATIKLLKDTNETIEITEEKEIVFDLQNHTVTYGTPTSGNTMINHGNVTITNGKIANTSSNGTINNYGLLKVTTGGIIEAGKKQAVYNDGGTLFIDGDAILTSTATDRSTIHNLNSGVATILGGTVTSSGWIAVLNENGSLTIGEKDGVVDTTTPIIVGKKFGVATKQDSASLAYNFYDGIIKGQTFPIGKTTTSQDTNYSRISDYEADSTIQQGVDDVYKTLYLEQTNSKYLITFNANGGQSSKASVAINQGSQIGELPTATRLHHNFLGWFTEKDGGSQISSATIPDGNTTYYAHWETQSSDEIVQFNIQTEALDGYYANIAAKSSDKDTWLKFLKSNFDSNNCMYNWKDSGQPNDDISSNFTNPEYTYTKSTTGIKCEQPREYDTGIAEGVDVFESDESTKTKFGNPVSYIDASDGIIRNMIPGKTYFWRSKADSDVYGYVKANGNRRFIELPGARNVRDLGGLTGDGGTIKYGRLIRGEALKSSDISALSTLGIDTEYELRISASEQSGAHMANKVLAGAINYDIAVDTSSQTTNYSYTRNALKQLMLDIVDGKNIYFHCTHGADRTGTIAYLAETLLGVSKEDRFQDYELTSLSGRPDRTRYYEEKSGNHKKFLYMTAKNDSAVGLELETYDSVLQWYLAGSEDEAADRALIAAFKAEILE